MDSIKPNTGKHLAKDLEENSALAANSRDKSTADSADTSKTGLGALQVSKDRRVELPYQVSSHLKGFTNDADLSSRPLMGAHNLPAVRKGGFVRLSTIDSWDGTPSHRAELIAKTRADIRRLASEGLITPELQDSTKRERKELANSTFGFNTFNMSSPRWMRKGP